jgi:hypothetical protein
VDERMGANPPLDPVLAHGLLSQSGDVSVKIATPV